MNRVLMYLEQTPTVSICISMLEILDFQKEVIHSIMKSFNNILTHLLTADDKSLAIMISAFLTRNLTALIFVPYKALRDDFRH